MRRSLVALAAVGALAACSGGGDEVDTATTTTVVESTTTTSEPEATTTTAPDVEPVDGTTTTAPVDEPGEGEGIGDLELLAPDLLVTAAELGEGFEDRGYSPGDTGPCGLAGEPDAVVGTVLGTDTATVTQELRVYPTPEAALAAYEARTCGGEDAVERMGGDAASSVVGADGTLTVVAVVSDAVTAVVVEGTPPSDPVDIAAYAVGKLLAAVGR